MHRPPAAPPPPRELTGRPVRSVEDLLDALRDTEPGRQVEVTAARGTGEIRPTVTIGTITG